MFTDYSKYDHTVTNIVFKKYQNQPKTKLKNSKVFFENGLNSLILNVNIKQHPQIANPSRFLMFKLGRSYLPSWSITLCVSYVLEFYFFKISFYFLFLKSFNINPIRREKIKYTENARVSHFAPFRPCLLNGEQVMFLLKNFVSAKLESKLTLACLFSQTTCF